MRTESILFFHFILIISFFTHCVLLFVCWLVCVCVMRCGACVFTLALLLFMAAFLIFGILSFNVVCVIFWNPFKIRFEAYHAHTQQTQKYVNRNENNKTNYRVKHTHTRERVGEAKEYQSIKI